MRRCSIVLIGLLALAATGCMSPKSFVRIMEPTWSSIEVRPGIMYEDAWREILDVLARRFEIEMISKDGGYLRTSWIYTWWKAGLLTEDYRVRTIVKFAPKRDKVDIKTEAQYFKGRQWIVGTDTRLLKTVKTDIMGVVGRTTR
jgi:hypothetical protein